MNPPTVLALIGMALIAAAILLGCAATRRAWPQPTRAQVRDHARSIQALEHRRPR